MSKKVGRKREKEREDVQLGILWDVGNHGCRNIYLCIGLGLNGTRWTSGGDSRVLEIFGELRVGGTSEWSFTFEVIHVQDGVKSSLESREKEEKEESETRHATTDQNFSCSLPPYTPLDSNHKLQIL